MTGFPVFWQIHKFFRPVDFDKISSFWMFLKAKFFNPIICILDIQGRY